MLSENVLNAFISLISAIGASEKEAQPLKSLLCKALPSSRLFEVLRSFGPLPSTRVLRPENIESFLRKNNDKGTRVPSEEEVRDFMRTAVGVPEMSLQEFGKWLCAGKGPAEKDQNTTGQIQPESLRVLKKLLALEIANCAETLAIFNTLKKSQGFNPYILFQALLPPKTDKITPKALFLFLRARGLGIEHFDPLQKRLFGELRELNFRDFSRFFSKMGGFEPSAGASKTQRFLKEILEGKEREGLRKTSQILGVAGGSPEDVLRRKNSSDYVRYLLKVRNTEAKVAKIQAEFPQKSSNSALGKRASSTGDLFLELLKGQHRVEKEVEGIKEDLSLRADVSKSAVIGLFDFESKGFITMNNLQAMLPESCSFDEADLIALIRRYNSKSNRNFLGYKEFLHFLVPKSGHFARLYEEREEFSAISQKSVSLVETLIFRALETEANWRTQWQKLAEKAGDFIDATWRMLDREGKGFFTLDDLRDLLNSGGVFPTKQEIELIYSRFDPCNEGIVGRQDYEKIIGFCDV